MHDPIRGSHAGKARDRNSISGLILGSVVLVAATATSARAGAIRHATVHETSAARVSASAANPWGTYWQNALLHHTMHVHGPKAMTMLSLSADGTLPASPFAEYLLWRQSLSIKRFNSFHPQVARILHKIKITTIPPIATPTPSTPGQPGIVYPPGTPIPIQPPDFTPITPSEQIVPPPQVPEPSTGLIALVMLGGAVAARRWARRRSG